MTAERNRSLSKFTQRDEDGTVFTLSLEIALYTDRPKEELVTGPVDCYALFLERYEPSLRWFLASSMRREKKFSQKYVDVFPTLCQEPDPEFALPFYRVFCGDGMLDYLPPAFATLSDGTYSCLQIHLENSMAECWEELLAILNRLAAAFPFRYGHVGYSLCWNDMSVDRDAEVSALIGPLLKRYPGLSLGNPFALCSQNLAPVNWLTMIGPDLLKELGGLDQVARDLSDDAITVMPMGPGACIRAGERPQFGDRNRADDLPLYRRVGSYLRKYRAGGPATELTGLDEEESEAWLARFDT